MKRCFFGRRFTFGSFICIMLMLILAIASLTPFIACVLTALKTKNEYTSSSTITPPMNWFNIDNFVAIWEQHGMVRAMANSFFLVTSISIVTTLEAAMMAFVISRRFIRFRKLILMMYLVASLIPSVALQVGAYKIMTAFRLVNSLYGYIILASELDFLSLVICVQQANAINLETDEAAKMDGSGVARMFFSIHLPMMYPALVTVFILKGIFIYNEYYNAGIYLQDKTRFMTVTTLLNSFRGPYSNQYHLICSGIILSMLPVFILFILAQKRLYSGVNVDI